jgi:hypothetical protein
VTSRAKRRKIVAEKKSQAQRRVEEWDGLHLQGSSHDVEALHVLGKEVGGVEMLRLELWMALQINGLTTTVEKIIILV